VGKRRSCIEAAMVRAKLKDVLLHAAGLLYLQTPTAVLDQLVKVHRWRNRRYVGEAGGSVLAWSGFSINLAHLEPAGKAIYGDHVACPLPSRERQRLFGEQFARAIEDMPEFAVLFNCDVPVAHAGLVQERGFIPRPMGRKCHIGVIYGCEDLLAAPIEVLGSRVVALVQLQQALLASGSVLTSVQVPACDRVPGEHPS
jgi:hypothetical protein